VGIGLSLPPAAVCPIGLGCLGSARQQWRKRGEPLEGNSKRKENTAAAAAAAVLAHARCGGLGRGVFPSGGPGSEDGEARAEARAPVALAGGAQGGASFSPAAAGAHSGRPSGHARAQREEEAEGKGEVGQESWWRRGRTDGERRARVESALCLPTEPERTEPEAAVRVRSHPSGRPPSPLKKQPLGASAAEDARRTPLRHLPPSPAAPSGRFGRRSRARPQFESGALTVRA